MRRFLLCVVLMSLAACSSNSGDDCQANPALCDDCSTPGAHCAGMDGGTSDARGNDAALLSLSVSPGQLSPAFSPNTTLYKVLVGNLVEAVQVTATTTDAQATLEVNGTPLQSGVPSAPIPLSAMTTILVTVHGRDATTQSYTLVVTRSQWGSSYLKASNPGWPDYFGGSVSLSGDTLAVGAVDESSKATGIGGDQSDNSSESSGAVYVFRRTGAVWAQEAYVKASNTGLLNHFGTSVSLSGDTLAVGAPGESSKATGVNGDQSQNALGGSGAVYVFQRTGTTWAQQAYVKASNPDSQDNFGTSVSLSGDTLAVGALNESSSASGIGGNQADNSAKWSGAVYVFQRTGAVWAQQAYVKAANPDAYDYFGYSVALSGDTLAVGAYGESSGATGVNGDQTSNSASQSGAAYVFQRTGIIWTQQAYLKASNTEAKDFFGYSVALSGDTLAVGAQEESSSASGVNGDQTNNDTLNSGAVYVFQRTGTQWAQQAYVKASNPDAGDGFGIYIALLGDKLAVGAISEASRSTGVNGDQTNNADPYSGAVYLFQRTGTQWTQAAYLKASNTDRGDNFGTSIALSNDTIAIGAIIEASLSSGVDGDQTDNSAAGAGAVYVFQ